MKPSKKIRKPRRAEIKRAQRRAQLVAAGLAKARGPEPMVTMDVVGRVGKRMALGLPLDYSLALEKSIISVDCFHKALQRDAKLSTHLTRFKAEFIEGALTTLSSGDSADLKWLLLRRHPDIFAMPSERAESSGNTVADGLQELVNQARKYAQLKAVEETTNGH